MIKFEVNLSSGNVITRTDDFCHGLQNQHSEKDYASFILS